MKTLLKPFLPLSLFLVVLGLASARDEDHQAAPLRILLVAGGCCHDYAQQSKILNV